MIASVIVGEARGNVTNYAYILSDVKSEEKIDDTYYWTFDAATREGIVTLTATSKYRSTISQLVKNTIEELRFTGDYVSKIIPLTMDVTALDTVINAGSDETYHVTGLVDRDMYLQGRTLWVENSPVASGLTFVSDANAVVIQPVNGKETKTAYSSVEEAISSLGDYDKVADGLQFCGDIAAVLNNQGVAEWIVFKSTVDAGSGHGPSYGEDTNRGVTAVPSINGFGQVRVSLTAARPSYVPQSANVNVVYDVYVNGALASIGESATILGGTNSVVDTVGFLASDPSDTITVQIKSVTFSSVKVNYTGNVSVVLDDATKTDEELTVGKDAMAFTLNTTAVSGTVNYTVKQGDKTLTTGAHNLTTGKKVNVASMTAVTDTSAVTVEVNGTLASTYSVTNNVPAAGINVATGINLKVAVTTSPVTGLVYNTEVTGTIALDSASFATGIAGYRVVCSKLGIDTVLTNTTAHTWDIRVTSDVVIDSSDFSITPVATLTAESFTYNAGVITIKFNKELVEQDLTLGTDFYVTASNGASTFTAKAIGNEVRIYAGAGNFGVGDKFQVNAGLKAADGVTLATAYNQTLA